MVLKVITSISRFLKKCLNIDVRNNSRQLNALKSTSKENNPKIAVAAYSSPAPIKSNLCCNNDIIEMYRPVMHTRIISMGERIFSLRFIGGLFIRSP